MIHPSFHHCLQERINHNAETENGKESLRVIRDTIRHIRHPGRIRRTVISQLSCFSVSSGNADVRDGTLVAGQGNISFTEISS
jgi:hypothetical protein